MTETMSYVLHATIIGAGATAVMDIWTIARRARFAVPLANYALVGRWLAWMPRGRLPTGIVATGERVAPSMTVKSPDRSLEMNTG